LDEKDYLLVSSKSIFLSINTAIFPKGFFMIIVKYKAEVKKYFSKVKWQDEKIKRFWYEDEPIVTHFMNAISIAIPETERFLVRSVKPYSHLLTKELDIFINDENEHSLQHTRFNKVLKTQNYPVNFGLKFTKFGFSCIYKLFSKKTQLAMAVCFEHMTAVIANYGFEYEVMLEDVSKIYDLFIWHAFEELNHRSVVNDVYVEIGGGYVRRVLCMLYVTFFFIVGVVVIQARFILSDLFNCRGIKMKHWWYALKFFFGRKGMVFGSLKYYLPIFKFKYIP